jgi:hypothetical protein
MAPLMTHRLVVNGNQHSVPMYTDEQTFLKISRMRQESGIKGMAGKAGNAFVAKSIDDRTPVIVLTSDDKGALVKITDGPMKGRPALSPNRTPTSESTQRK